MQVSLQWDRQTTSGQMAGSCGSFSFTFLRCRYPDFYQQQTKVPPSTYHCQHLLPSALLISRNSFFDFLAIFTQVRWNFNEALICDSLMATDISHFNTHLLGSCTSLESCLFRSLSSFLSPSSCVSSVCISLYILGISTCKHVLFKKSEEVQLFSSCCTLMNYV